MKSFCLHIEKEEDLVMYQKHSSYHNGDAGLDLFITSDTIFQPGETLLVDLGVRCQSRSFSLAELFKGKIYKYHSYLLMPRSSISKTPLIMRNSIGLIDKGYTGTLKASLYNTSEKPFLVRRGERYLQLVNGDLSPVHMEIVKTLRTTSRGDGGFGSTGK